VVSERGTVKNKARVKTSVKGFMEFVKTVPKPRKIFIEEGTLASWLLETSMRYGERLIITDPKTNKWIGKSIQKVYHAMGVPYILKTSEMNGGANFLIIQLPV